MDEGSWWSESRRCMPPDGLYWQPLALVLREVDELEHLVQEPAPVSGASQAVQGTR